MQSAITADGVCVSIDLRKLAAIAISFLGRGVILAEFASGVVLSAAVGLFVLFRQHSFWQIVLGVYFLCLGLNYLAMFAEAVGIPTRESARAELGDELGDKSRAMSKYWCQSVLLLIPFLVPMLALGGRRQPQPR